MAYETLSDMFEDIASAIRDRSGKSGSIIATDFPDEIKKIVLEIGAEPDYSDSEPHSYATLSELFYDIAEAIRYKESSKGLIPAEDFADRIRALPYIYPEDRTISYDVVMAEGYDYPEGVDPNGTFQEVSAYAALVKSVFTKATIFNNSYSFDVNVPVGYTAKVYREYTNPVSFFVELTGDREDIEDESLRKSRIINAGYPLGTEPTYEWNGNNLGQLSKDSPPTFLSHATFEDDKVGQRPHLVVELTERNDVPVFDASRVVNHIGLSGRGSTGIDVGWTGSGYPDGNISTTDNWDWSKDTSLLHNIPLTKDPDGTYSYNWTFQTNSSNNMILDVFQVNLTPIQVPFIPETTSKEQDAEAAIGNPGTFAITKLSDGGEVKIRMIREFGSVPQRVYTVDFSKIKGNITVTNGNLHFRGNDPRCFIGPLTGIYTTSKDRVGLELYDDGWWEPELFYGTSRLFGDVGDYDNYGANVRFKLMEGYKNPTYSYSNGEIYPGTIESTRIETENGFEQTEKPDAIVPIIEGTVDEKYLNSSGKYLSGHIYGPDTDGWYYIRIIKKPDSNLVIATLSINAN